MKLNNEYQNNQEGFPTINMMVGELIEEYKGQHRGQEWNYPYPRHIPKHRHPPKKMYYKDVSDKTKQTFSFLPTKTDQESQAKNNVAQVHITNLCNILERRCLLAEARGDEKLLSLLQDEWRYICCG
ncbi:MAG: hypothetical protein AB4080_05200 [Trichodesmium sp.]